MRLKYYSIIGFLILYFFSTTISAQTTEVLKEYESLTLKDKLHVFKSLPDNDIIENSHLLINELSRYSNETLDIRTFFNLQLALVDLNYFNANYIKSVTILKELLILKGLTLSDKVEVLSKLKRSYYKLNLYPEIFELNSKIKKLIEEGAKYPLWTYNMNSRLYAELKLYDKAALTLRKELEELIAADNNEHLMISSGFNDLGYYYFKVNNYNSALLNYNKSLSYAEETLIEKHPDHFRDITALVKGNIAEIYVRKKQYADAIPLLLEDIEVGLANNGNLKSTGNSYNLLVLCYVKTKAYDKAIVALNEMTPVLDVLIDKRVEVAYLKNKAALFYEMNEKDSAHFYLNEAFKFKDSIEVKDINKILASNELIYTRAEERKLLDQHKIDLKNQEIELKNKQKNIVILLAVLLFILLTFSLYNSYFLKKSRKEVRLKNEEILEKNKQIKRALSEKEVLLKEVHHRVKNNLQIISGLLELQHIDIDNEEIKILLKEGQNRIQSVALVHKMMYQSDTISKVNMQNYLEELLYVLDGSYKNNAKSISRSIMATEIDFDVTTAVPISLIVNEAVCNAYKHAFQNKKEGKIEVAIKNLKEDRYLLSIKDDGIGLANDFDMAKLNSIGFDLIKGLSRQLKGDLKVLDNSGTEIQITFKKAVF